MTNLEISPNDFTHYEMDLKVGIMPECFIKPAKSTRYFDHSMNCIMVSCCCEFTTDGGGLVLCRIREREFIPKLSQISLFEGINA